MQQGSAPTTSERTTTTGAEEEGADQFMRGSERQEIDQLRQRLDEVIGAVNLSEERALCLGSTSRWRTLAGQGNANASAAKRKVGFPGSSADDDCDDQGQSTGEQIQEILDTFATLSEKIRPRDSHELESLRSIFHALHQRDQVETVILQRLTKLYVATVASWKEADALARLPLNERLGIKEHTRAPQRQQQQKQRYEPPRNVTAGGRKKKA